MGRSLNILVYSDQNETKFLRFRDKLASQYPAFSLAIRQVLLNRGEQGKCELEGFSENELEQQVFSTMLSYIAMNLATQPGEAAPVYVKVAREKTYVFENGDSSSYKMSAAQA